MDEINNTSVENKPLIEGSMFIDPNTNEKYRIGRIKNDTYTVIDLTDNQIIKWKKNNFDKLEYIGFFDFNTGKTTYPQQNAGKSKRRRMIKKKQTRQKKHRKSKSRRHRR